jgi:phosphopantothenoylcysteine synthetase/decarboxylase
MTKEHAKMILPYLIAYSEGKDVRFKGNITDSWFKVDDSTDWSPIREYKIFEEPEMIELDKTDDLIMKVIKHTNFTDKRLIIFQSETHVGVIHNVVTYKELRDEYVFADGSKCEKVKNEQSDKS